MVKAKWVGDTIQAQKLVVEPVSPEEEARLAPFVVDTLQHGMVAIFEGMAYANDEAHAREKLEW